MVEKTSDLVFVGHSHREEQRLVDDLEGRSTLYINGGIFQDETAPNICQFKTISFDSATNKVNILSYDWKSSHFECVNNIKEQKIKHKNLKKQFTINEKTEKWLNSVETLIHHSGKDELFLSDIFVYPEIASLSDLKKKERSPILPLDSEKVLVLKDESNKILILGDRKSGKTALLKVLFRRYFEDDKFVPVFLHGSKIKSAAIDVFVKTINSAFVEQYSIDSINNFHALKNEKKVIILDDFDKCKLNSNNTKALLSTVTKYYPNIIMTASSLFEINEFITDDTKDNPIDLYSCFQIEQYSRVQRSHLIENWCYLDDQYTLEEFLTNVDNSKDTINKIFENGYVPRYPFYILTILQTIQQSDPDQLLFSSYGHYYEVLFRNAIGRIVHTNDNIEALFQFLPELAYSCFKKRVKTLSLTEFEAFRKWYCDEYKISPNMHIIFDNDALTKTLIESTMININQGEVKFNAKWVYYFFLARYMASNLEQRVVKDQISSICKRLYRDEFANIVLFLVHHTRNEFVLNEILINSQQLFEEFKPMNLETDIEGINSLIDEIPKLVIEDKDYMKERIKIDQNKDNIETANLENGSDFQNEEEDIIDPSEEILELDLPAKIGVSMRMIEILGLILKNHHSSLKGNTKYV